MGAANLTMGAANLTMGAANLTIVTHLSHYLKTFGLRGL